MFKSYNAYNKFATRVRTTDRFGLHKESQEFLEIFREGILERAATLKKGSQLNRAVRDYVEEQDVENGRIHVTGADEGRVLPKREFAFEGRVNPSGTLVLYLASTMETAVSEVRPWIGETISVANLSIVRDLRIVDLSKGHGRSALMQLSFAELLGEKIISDQKANKCVWIEIDNAFSQPTTKTDSGAEYAPTQLLSEIIKNEGYDGIVYKSSFGGERGYNIALFNVKDAKVSSCNAFSISNIKIDFEQAGNAWAKT